MKHEMSVEKSFINTAQIEMSYWKKVLLRVVEVVKFLTSRGLAIRGHDEILGSKHNGNFLGCVELLAKFDPFLEEHISRFGNKGKGTVFSCNFDECNSFNAYFIIRNISRKSFVSVKHNL